MSAHAAFRRQPVNPQFAQNLHSITIPAPVRGIIQSENEAFMQPGGANVQVNWVTTMKGVKLRGGCVRWCDLHALDGPPDPLLVPAWKNVTFYSPGSVVRDTADNSIWKTTGGVLTPNAPVTFAEHRALTPELYTPSAPPLGSPLPPDDPARKPVISAFEYVDGITEKMFAATADRLFDVSTGVPSLIKDGQGSGNYFAVQMNNNAGVNYMIVGNDAGNLMLRTHDGAEFFLLGGAIGAAGDGVPNITYDPAKLPSGVSQGTGLTYAWKYRNRLYFIQRNSMNAWYLPLDAVGGVLLPIYLAGAANKGGKLLFGASWSIDTGDGIDDKCVFATDLGELLIFTGSNPGDAANWRQEGRYQIGAPLGMNSHMLLGGDLLIATVEGITPVSQAIQKDSGSLGLALLTKNIKPLWREEVADKRSWPWTMKRWDEYGGIFVATPGGTTPDTRHCLAANNETGAWCIFTWDATCWLRMRTDMFFGTQKGLIMQADRTGCDDGLPYTATLVGGWETFQSGAAQTTWHQARAVFISRFNQPFVPQLSATTDHQIIIPPPPPPGVDPGVLDAWDEGLWDEALWDAATMGKPPVRNTMWVSIGMSGFAHAPIVQVQVAQQARPDVELIAIGTTQERGGVNV